MDVKGVKVAQLSYAYGFNDARVPRDRPWLVNEIDPAKITTDARRAREAGADQGAAGEDVPGQDQGAEAGGGEDGEAGAGDP